MIVASPVAVHRIVAGPFEANCYVVSSAEGDAVVLDPGAEAERIVEHVAAYRLRVHAVLATHGHPDHVGAAAEVVGFYGVPFGIHSGESDALGRVNFYRFALHEIGRIDVPPVDLDLAVETDMRFGDLRVAVVHTPGHSPGSVCLEIGRRIFTGDTLMATRLGSTDTPGSDAGALRASVRRLAEAYPADTAIHPGHGGPGRLGQAVAMASVGRAGG